MNNRALIVCMYILFCSDIYSQSVDYRDAFIGLYHTANPPCVNANEQDPPNRYVLIEKDTLNSIGIVVYDTAWYDSAPPNYYGFKHPCNLNQSDSSYMDGGQLGKFVHTDSLRIIGNWCGFGYIYYLKKMVPVGIYIEDRTSIACYLFPNPTITTLNVVIPELKKNANLKVLDLTGKVMLNKQLTGATTIDVSIFPRGVYLVQITGSDIYVNSRLVLTE